MWRLLRNTLVSVLFLGVSAQAQTSLDTVRQYRVAAYRQLGWDTTGNSFMPTSDVDKFVALSVNQLPSWVFGDEKVKSIVVSKSSGDAYYVDSNVVQIKAVTMYDRDSLITLLQRPEGFWNNDYSGGEEGSRILAYYSFFADTLYLYPSPLTPDGDSLRVKYYRGPSASSTSGTGVINLAREFQIGLVYLTAYQIAVAAQPLADWQGAWTRYMNWVAATKENLIQRPVDLRKDERQ